MKIRGNIPNKGLAEIEWDAGRITTVRNIGADDPSMPFVAPGLTDIQFNGFEGIDFTSEDLEPEQVVKILPAVWKTGVTTFCPTLITSSHKLLARNFRVLEAARKMDPRFARATPCYHLEGPYISPGPARGVHDTNFMRPPSLDELKCLQEAAGNNIGIVTVAPEMPGAFDFIQKATQMGITVALGHTDATPEEIHQAAACGAKLNTHLGNGSPQMMDRHRAPFWAQLADDRLFASIICDSFHLPQELVQIISRVKGARRYVLITDASHVAGLPPGIYHLPHTDIELLPDGKLVTLDRRCLAGSAIGLNRALHVFMEFGGGSLADAVRAATANPAELLPGKRITRYIRKGEPANVVLFNLGTRELNIQSVILAGEWVYDHS